MDPQRFPREDIASLRVNPQEIQEEHVKQARVASLGIAIEAAAQIAEAHLPRGGQIREDLPSLEHVLKTTRDGNQLAREVFQQDKGMFLQKAREAVARRLKVTPDKVNLSEQQLTKWVDEQFVRAHTRLSHGARALQGYFGR